MLFVSTVFIPAAYSQPSDFLIVQNTDHLVIYDSFQQSFPSSQRAAIRPFAPMRILARRELLGDGLTPCMKVEVDGEVFFLLRDESGKLSGWKHLGSSRTFQRRQFIGDTIEVIQSNRIAMQYPEKEGANRLRTEDRLIRYFDDGGATYVKKLGPRPTFGWVVLPMDGREILWKVVRPERLRIGLSQMLRERVIARVTEINGTFVQVYGVLGKETGRSFPVPHWAIDSSGAVLSCVLRPATSVRFYPKSVGELATELQAYVVGTGYVVSTVENRIEIRQP